jgi:D-sedoheptulose 7-phosphate isomerase
MSLSAGEYYRNLGAMTDSLRVTDTEGNELGLDRGTELACGLVAAAGGGGFKVMFIGNGGSAAIASHMAIDFWKNGGIRATAFNDSSLLTCLGNDFGYGYIFEKPIEMFASPGDLLFAISSSGQSENILRGVQAAKAKGCKALTFSGFKGDNPLSRLGDVNFYVPSGAYGPVEVIHQSLCHCILDIYMLGQGMLREEDFRNA